MCPLRSVTKSGVEIRCTTTHELVIQGTGFTRVFLPTFVFEPPIAKQDYVVHVRLGACAAVGTVGVGGGNIAVLYFYWCDLVPWLCVVMFLCERVVTIRDLLGVL